MGCAPPPRGILSTELGRGVPLEISYPVWAKSLKLHGKMRFATHHTKIVNIRRKYETLRPMNEPKLLIACTTHVRGTSLQGYCTKYTPPPRPRRGGGVWGIEQSY